jgi:predicted RNase H-like nuclease (RuvC/YqgF family)
VIIQRILNNNVVIVKNKKGQEEIVCGKGIAQRIENLESLLLQAKELQQNLETIILDLQNQLIAAGITVEQQKKEIEKLKDSLQSALIYSSNLEQITSDLNKSVEKDQIKIKSLELQRGLLIGGCVVTFAGGVAVGILVVNALSK